MDEGGVQVVGPGLPVAQRGWQQLGEALPAGGFVEFRPGRWPRRGAVGDSAWRGAGQAATSRQAGATAGIDAGATGQRQGRQQRGLANALQAGTRQTSMTLAKGLPSFIGSVSTVKPKLLIRSTHSASVRQ